RVPARRSSRRAASRAKASPIGHCIRGTCLATAGAMLSVLSADDESHVVELVRVTLEDERVRVFEAPDGQTALAVADAFGIDLVVLDVHLPVVSGLVVWRRLGPN